MQNAKPTAQDEATFMEDLLSGINSSFFTAVPSPDPTPKKRKRATQELVNPKPTITNIEIGSVNGTPGSAKKPRTSEASFDADIAALLEGAEDWDWNDMLSPVRKKPTSVVPSPEVDEPVFRCLVESIEHCGSSKKLRVVSEDELVRRIVVLKDDWIETDIRTDDILNIIGSFSLHDQTITISAKRNLLIQHPDILITATSVASASHCSRRPLLSLLVRSSSDKSRALVWGNMIHEIMQRCLCTQRWDASSIETIIDDTIEKSLMELLHIEVGMEEARVEINKRTSGLKMFGERFLGDIPKRNAILSNTRDAQNTVVRLAITQLHDVEEDIWVPKYGLKGKIDASVQVRIDEDVKFISQKHKQPTLPPHTTTTTTTTTMPLEIKTGRAIAGMEHRAQTMLYTLLMAERYGASLPSPIPRSPSIAPAPAPGGLLFYTQSEEVIKVPSGWNEIRGLIMTRNELATYLARRSKRKQGTTVGGAGTQKVMREDDDEVVSFLPPTIDQERACGRCYAADACMLYRKAIEGVEDNYSPIADLYELKTGHLSKNQLKFFKQWENLISLEEQDITRFRKELWTLGADDREKMGRCLSNMVLDRTFVPHEIAKDARIHQYTYRFVRRAQSPASPPTNEDTSSSRPRSFLHGHITSGDPVTVSVADDPRLLALARGFVLELAPEKIVIGVDHILSTEFIRSRRLCYSPEDDIVFRIDKDDLIGGMGRVRDNLAQLFYVTGSRRLLEYIVDLKPPAFDAESQMPVGLCSEGLNVSQQHALEHSLRARDYALILGMPGTGKTTTVAHMIRTLVGMGKTVLLTSYTHSAVDTILLKLKNAADFEILRLGNKDKVHPDIQEFTLSQQKPPTTVEQLEQQVLSPPVVATTALSTDHALFSRRRFDYCIVDEASQITLPTCIGPLRFADKFILVGDHFQLPPLVKSRDARKGGFDVSLFRRLSDAHPNAVVDLAYQYRMNTDIMLLTNRLIYGDRLKCGSDEVANRSLNTPQREDDCTCGLHGSSCWLRKIMDESCKAIFVDTDALPALDSRVGDLVQNEVEASLVHQLTIALLNSGVCEDQIGIISMYRQQIKLLSRLLQEQRGVEILTADKSQGRDKDCIIISLVRANKDNQIGDLLKDWRRINVAFTRARAKLVIFGSRKTLKASALLSDFFELMEERDWVLALPAGADAAHAIPSTDFAGQESSASKGQLAKENKTGRQDAVHPKKIKQGTVENGLTRARPILRDLLNDTT